jgi:hypothetical protein
MTQTKNVRRAGATSAATLCGLALTIVLAHAIAPDWMKRFGLDVWNLPSAIAATRTAEEQLATLNAQEDQLFREIELGDRVTAQVAAGRMTLLAAVDEMEPILQNRGGFATTLKHDRQIGSFRKGVARYLFSRIPRVANNDPVQLTAVLAHLEEEYAQIN